jgi:hypothetical protein
MNATATGNSKTSKKNVKLEVDVEKLPKKENKVGKRKSVVVVAK